MKIAYNPWKCMAEEAVPGIKIVHSDNIFLKKGDNSAAGVSVLSIYICSDHDCCVPGCKLLVNKRTIRL
jgi:hypothetical protein